MTMMDGGSLRHQNQPSQDGGNLLLLGNLPSRGNLPQSREFLFFRVNFDT